MRMSQSSVLSSIAPRTVEEVLAHLCSFNSLGYEDVSLLQGLEGRVLAKDIHAIDAKPLTHCVGMGSRVAQHADIPRREGRAASCLRCIGYCCAGKIAPKAAQEGPCPCTHVQNHSPESPTAITDTAVKNACTTKTTKAHTKLLPPPAGSHQGQDAQPHETLLLAGTLLRPQEIALLASMGVKEEALDLDYLIHGSLHNTVHVAAYTKPQVALISVGDDIFPVHSVISAGQVRDITSHALASLVRDAGGLPRFHGIVRYDAVALTEALERTLLSSAHVVFVSVGCSAQAQDVMVQALQALPKRHDIQIFCQGVQLLPGNSLVLATAGEKSIWFLPHQMTAVQVLMHVLGQPFLRHLQGLPKAFAQENPLIWKQCQATLLQDITSDLAYAEYKRVRVDYTKDGRITASPIEAPPSLLQTMLDTKGLVYLEKNCQHLAAGSMVRVLLFS